jgi:general secretion pathway protein C
MKRLPILLSLLALVALSASIAYWVLQLYQPAQRPLAAAPAAALPDPAVDAAATLFGGQAATAVASNYQLTGVVAAGPESVAIIVADGAPAKALTLGKEVANGVTVREVHPRYVMLSDGGVLKRIELATDNKSGASAAAPQPATNPQPPQQQPQQQQQQQQQPQPVQLSTPPPQPLPQQQGQGQGQGQPQPQQGAAPPPPAAPVQMAPPTRPVPNPANQNQAQ